MGCIPKVGDTVTADGLSVEVTRVEKTRPDQIRVWKVDDTTEEE
jgi:CBS domain containing-hemolysin-like protein